MNESPIRADVAVAALPDARALSTFTSRAESLGYHGLVVADGLWLPAPFVLLAVAAGTSETLQLGTNVLAGPIRPAAEVAQQTDTLDLLSGGRFRLGLGIGAPHVAADGERFGRPYGSGAQRRAQLVETVREVRDRFAAVQRDVPQIMFAGIGPRLLELAAEHADAVALPVPHELDAEALGAKADELRTIAGDRFDRLELSSNILIVGDSPLPDWVPAFFQNVPADSHSRLTGTPSEMAAELRRRRDRYGISRVTVPQWAMESFAPVLESLAEH